MQVVPLDTSGNFSSTGKIVLLSVGMSNCYQEFQQLKVTVNGASYLNPNLVLINGAQPGQTINFIIDPNAQFWTEINNLLAQSGLSPKQVQAIWFKEAESTPQDTTFPSYPAGLKNKYKTAVKIMKTKYKNLKLCYSSSRIYGGYAPPVGLNPEPYAYYTGWSVKWMIEDQINGDTALLYKGVNPNSPWLSWGPYIWADGINPRNDGLTWNCPADFVGDGTHLSSTGKAKVANMLLDFFKTDETSKPWFLKNLTLDLNIVFEGLYNSNLNIMNLRDTITSYLRNVGSPYSAVDSSKAVVDTSTLKGICKYYNVNSGTYYIQINHRNCLETWSKIGGQNLIFGNTAEYSFSDTISNAYGGNMKQVDITPVKFAIFSGDVTHDGNIDVQDIIEIYNNVTQLSSGYLNTDLNGDNFTDAADLLIAYNNMTQLITVIKP